MLTWILFALIALGLPALASSQQSKPVPPMRIRLGSFGPGGGGEAIRKRLADRLNRSGRVQTVDTGAADATLQGQSNIWAAGTFALEARSRSYHSTAYQGYVSVDLVGKDGQTEWSYLATPSRFRMQSITDNLADEAAAQLIAAIVSGKLTLTGASPSETHVRLHAAGATLPAPLYRKWIESVGMPVAYDAVGSEAGIEALRHGEVDFAASDMPLAPENTPPGLDVVQVPTVVGGVVPIYNIEGGADLRLTPDLLAGIYLGTIRRWNDPRIRQVNREARLPDAEIAVVHRSDGSGTTFVWTSYLAQVSPEWKQHVGTGARVNWPVGAGAAGNEGVAELVKKTPNSIGYVELIYAIQHQLSYAAVRNASGVFLKANLENIASAGAGAMRSKGGAIPLSILNAPQRDAYPISTFTWLLVPRSGTDAQKKKAVADLLHWMLTAGQRQCSSLGYAPLPRDVTEQALKLVDSIR